MNKRKCKNKNDVNITFIAEKKKLNLIKRIAKNNHQSISGCLRVIVDDYLKRSKKK